MTLQILVSTVTVVAAVMAAATAGRIRRAGPNIPDLTPNTIKVNSCTTRDGREGICANEAECDENFDIVPGGDVDDSEIREKKCSGKYTWCCSLDKVKAQMNKTKPPKLNMELGCSIISGNDCPWCVSIYRNGGNPFTKAPSGLFCAGALIGTRAILTGAGCVLQARGLDVWVRVPASSKPTYNYNVQNSMKHSSYNSGTRENDVALMILSEDVEWNDAMSRAKGACLGIRSTLTGSCSAFGFNTEDDIVMSRLTVAPGGCVANREATYDTSCGTGDASCSVAYGSPVLCPSVDGGSIVVGVARSRCRDGSVMLGGIQQSARWVQEELTRIGLVPYNYTIGI